MQLQSSAPKPRRELPTLGPRETAAAIRQLLRVNFPACKFSVTVGRGSGSSSVDVRWTDGPTSARVNALVSCFEAGHFDGMTDSYSYDRDSYLMIGGVMYRPGTRYVMTARTCSPALVAKAARAVMDYRWAFESPEIAAKAEALVAALEANPNETTRNAFYSEAWNIYPGNTQPGCRQGHTLCERVNLALSDRTTTVQGA